MSDGEGREPENGAGGPEQSAVDWDPKLERMLEDWRLGAWGGQVANYRVASHLRGYKI